MTDDNRPFVWLGDSDPNKSAIVLTRDLRLILRLGDNMVNETKEQVEKVPLTEMFGPSIEDDDQDYFEVAYLVAQGTPDNDD
jgi:ribosomal 50S subunit-associated protein YjgA (DUF615 family)